MFAALRDPFARKYLLASLAITLVTAYFSYAYFHIDEYWQIISPTRVKLGQVDLRGLPWEYASEMRSWLQPAIYVALGRAAMAVGVSDPFALALVFRVATALVGWLALVALVTSSVRWVKADDARRAMVRVLALLGFLPYLLVRTSSESLSMSVFTLGFALLARDGLTAPTRARTLVAIGLLFGAAFELRFQTALMTIGVLGWMRFVARAQLRAIGLVILGAAAAVALEIPIDAWGYGKLAFPPVAYARTNLVEGAAQLFGAEPPFAYLWLSPANLFLPIVALLIVAMLITWARRPRHPATWATLPFFLVHNVLAHKEERFLFPMAMIASTFVVLAFAPEGSSSPPSALDRFASLAWSRRSGAVARALVAFNFAAAALLALYPIGWHHHVPFTRYVTEARGGELYAYALPEFDLGIPPYLPRAYFIEKRSVSEIAARVTAGDGPRLLVADTPRLRTGAPAIDEHARLVYSEMPFWQSDAITDATMRVVDAYNAVARPPLRPIAWRSVYELR